MKSLEKATHQFSDQPFFFPSSFCKFLGDSPLLWHFLADGPFRSYWRKLDVNEAVSILALGRNGSLGGSLSVAGLLESLCLNGHCGSHFFGFLDIFLSHQTPYNRLFSAVINYVSMVAHACKPLGILGGLKQDGHQFAASLGYIASSVSRKQNKMN